MALKDTKDPPSRQFRACGQESQQRTGRGPLGQERPGNRNWGGSGAPIVMGAPAGPPGAGTTEFVGSCRGVEPWGRGQQGPEAEARSWPSLTSAGGSGRAPFGNGPWHPVGSRIACLSGRPDRPGTCRLYQAEPLPLKANLGQAGRKGLDLGHLPSDTGPQPAPAAPSLTRQTHPGPAELSPLWLPLQPVTRAHRAGRVGRAPGLCGTTGPLLLQTKVPEWAENPASPARHPEATWQRPGPTSHPAVCGAWGPSDRWDSGSQWEAWWDVC